jgi:enoyl-CoA hydratase/carnithine racemase
MDRLLTTVEYRLRDGVAWITMNRPEVMNASNVAMKEDLGEAVAVAERDPAARVIVLTGNGKAFCSGGDRKEAAASTHEIYRARIRLQQQLCLAIWNAGKPVIAAINGHALGGGLEMAVMCDIRLAARSAMLGAPVSRIGSISTGALHDQLARIVGVGHAMHMLLTSDPISAETALRLGLVTGVFDDDALAKETHRLAVRIGDYPAESVTAAKRALHAACGTRLNATLDLEEDLAVGMFGKA